jgi:hypothetical protein
MHYATSAGPISTGKMDLGWLKIFLTAEDEGGERR